MGDPQMSKNVIVRYRTRPEAAQENARLVKEVYAALAEVKPDGVTFVHVASLDGPVNPLTTLPAFAEFQRDLGQRCAEPPAPSDASVVGSYGSGA
jgi:hypothetical protein